MQDRAEWGQNNNFQWPGSRGGNKLIKFYYLSNPKQQTTENQLLELSIGGGEISD